MVIKMALNYGKIIKQLREKENISQREIAEALNIKRSSFNQFEQQYDIIPLKRLNQVANFFNVSLDYLLGFNKNLNYKNSNNEIDFEKSSKRLKEFRREHKLTQEKLASILKTSPSVIGRHENRNTLLGTPIIYALCNKYKISADYLLGKIDKPQDIS